MVELSPISDVQVVPDMARLMVCENEFSIGVNGSENMLTHRSFDGAEHVNVCAAADSSASIVQFMRNGIDTGCRDGIQDLHEGNDLDGVSVRREVGDNRVGTPVGQALKVDEYLTD